MRSEQSAKPKCDGARRDGIAIGPGSAAESAHKNGAEWMAFIAQLPCWRAKVQIAPLDGGMTNRNYLVHDAGERFVVRLGEDLPRHGVLRPHELAAARAAHAAGLSPQVVFASPGVMVSCFVDGRTLQASDLRAPGRLPQLVDLLSRCHREIPKLLRQAAPMFRIFQVLRRYIAALQAQPDCLLQRELPRFAAMAAELQAAAGAPDPVFCHNDLLAANFLDDGHRMWLIDWEYAGFNSPLFDLANLSANNAFTAELDAELLARYFGAAPDAARWRAFGAMKCASVLRETLWGAVSHHSAQIEFDYAAYATTWLMQLEVVWELFRRRAAPR